jgi:hypothetical protein
MMHANNMSGRPTKKPHTSRTDSELFERANSRAENLILKADKLAGMNWAKHIANTLKRPARDENLALLQQVLRRFLKSWTEAGYDFEKWPLRSEFEALMRHTAPQYIQARSGGGPVHVRRVFEGGKPAAGRAVLLFHELITSPAYNRVRQCPRCSDFFVKEKDYAKRIYCSQRCASAGTAERAVRARREHERKERIANVRQAAKEFLELSAKQKARLNKRDWICDQTKKRFPPTGLSKKLVTMILEEEGL